MKRSVASKITITAARILIALLSIQSLLGQIQTGRIVGTVYDPNKAMVPNATLLVTNKDTKVAHKLSTNGMGGYVIPALNPGVYDVSATAPGFKTSLSAGIEMQVGKDLTLDFELSIGEASTMVEVNSTAPLLNSE